MKGSHHVAGRPTRPPRLTIQKWPSMEALKTYRNSAAFKALNREQYATFSFRWRNDAREPISEARQGRARSVLISTGERDGYLNGCLIGTVRKIDDAATQGGALVTLVARTTVPSTRPMRGVGPSPR